MIGEAIISGFISKIINDCADISKDKIERAIKNKKTEHQSIESQIYNVTVDALNQITNNQFMHHQDIVYDAAEILLKGYTNTEKDDIEVIRSGLKFFYLRVDDDTCLKFKELLYQELSKDSNRSLYREILLMQEEQESRKTLRMAQTVDEINQKLDNRIKDDNSKKFQNNMKQEYIKIWNSRLFLHMDNDERPVTLADAFIMPDYKMEREIRRIGFSADDPLDIIIDKFVKYDNTSTMLITGVPGIGKSSITSWMANRYKEDDRFIILRFRDWESEDLKAGILKAIYHMLACNKKDLENKILVLDGFDEMKSLSARAEILNTFFNDIKDFECFKCIITSRPAYIESSYFQNILSLKVFDIDRADIFTGKITGRMLESKDEIASNLDVLGIPVILYMAIMTDADIIKNSTKPELYNRIFAKKGGIFDRFNNGEAEYGKGKQILRNPENIKMYLRFLSNISYKMYERDSLSLLKEECQLPELEFDGMKISVLDFPVKHLFENAADNIEFIHKSIYEYFISEYIAGLLREAVDISKEEFAGILGDFLSWNILSPEILEFLKYKIKTDVPDNVFIIINNTFELLLENGMTYYTKKCYKNAILCELKVFANILEIMHLWEGKQLKFYATIGGYLKHMKGIKFNLKNADFSGDNRRTGIDLSEVDLREAELSGANLNNINLSGAYMKNAKLNNANLDNARIWGSDLRLAELNEAHFYKAYLNDANLSRAKLNGAFLQKARLNNAVLYFAQLRNANLEKANLGHADLKYADLQEANLKEAHLEGADLEGTNLKDAYIESSSWFDSDIRKALSQLKKANFNTLLIKCDDDKIIPISRSELFADEKQPSPL